MSDDFKNKHELQDEILDLRSELMAQNIIIHTLLNFLKSVHGKELKEAISDTVDSKDTGSLSDSLDEDGKERLVAIKNKLREYSL
ncbi:hypothetical protein [Erwinia tasmaniensis]|uniref:hypothetical protein n=1 Tax=Erwinia tasmaniensis TaxID=338565 RepID=UPI003A4E2DBE